MQDCPKMLEAIVVLRSYPNSIFECNRLYQSSYEENRKRTSQRYLPQTSRRSKFFIFLLFFKFWLFSSIFKERERKMDFVPERSEIQISQINAKDPVVKDLIRELGLKALVKAHKPQLAAGKKWDVWNLIPKPSGPAISKFLHAQIVYW